VLIPPSLHFGMHLGRIPAHCLPHALGTLVGQDAVKAGPNTLDGFPRHLLRRGFRAARAFDEKAESIVDSHDGTNQI
jgi:hypothetical protein